MSNFTRYYTPQGYGAAVHPCGKLYRREEVDAYIAALEARVAAADKLVEAGSVMSRALQGDYIVPGSAAKWDTALAAYEATKE